MIEHIIICSLSIFGLHKLMQKFNYGFLEFGEDLEHSSVFNPLFACACCMSSFYGTSYYFMHYEFIGLVSGFTVFMIMIAIASSALAISVWNDKISEIYYLMCVTLVIFLADNVVGALSFVTAVFCCVCGISAIYELVSSARDFFTQKAGEDHNAIADAFMEELRKKEK